MGYFLRPVVDDTISDVNTHVNQLVSNKPQILETVHCI